MPLLLISIGLEAVARQTNAQAVSVLAGRITGDSGAGIAAAEILTAAGRMARADSVGRFRMDSLPPGSHVFQVRALEYQPRAMVVTFVGHDTVSVNVALQRTTPRLDTLVVRSSRLLFAAQPEFDRRRRTGSGRFLTSEYLDKQEGRKFGDILATAGFGVHIVSGAHGGIGPRIPLVHRDMITGNCPMEVFLDYQRVTSTQFDIDMLNPLDVAGVEVYRGPSETPEEFGGPNEVCGTLVIWTRRR